MYDKKDKERKKIDKKGAEKTSRKER